MITDVLCDLEVLKDTPREGIAAFDDEFYGAIVKKEEIFVIVFRFSLLRVCLKRSKL